jgi:CRP/FNR family transcriptional regulator
MKAPYGLNILGTCLNCDRRQPESFCNVSPDLLRSLSALAHHSTYPSRAVLFVEGQIPRGVYLLCQGEVKLFTTSPDGKTLIIRRAGPGDVLGLSAVLTGVEYELTAETTAPSQLNFIRRDPLLGLLQQRSEAALRAALALSREYECAYHDIRDLLLARSSVGKLAKLLLSRCPGQDPCEEAKVRSALTHEEMAQMIGASRETVTRLMGQLKKKQFIRQEGSTLVIRNRPALEAMVA